MAVLIIHHHTMPTNANNDDDDDNAVNTSTQHHQQQQQDLANPTFHDFLGMKATGTPIILVSSTTETSMSEDSPMTSPPLAASSGFGRGLILTTSDTGSGERQIRNHLVGVPFYSPRSDSSGPEISNRIVGSKRGNTDSAFMGSYRDGIPRKAPDTLEKPHLLKTLRNGAGGEPTRKCSDDELVLRPNSASIIFQPPTATASRSLDATVSKWERSIHMNMGPATQYPPGGKIVQFLHQVPSSRFRDANAGPSNISQPAKDEGSRTGMKGPRFLGSIGAINVASERNSSGFLPSCNMQKPRTNNTLQPESTIPPSRRGLVCASRQMTIFYGGQAHVFDDVLPNKADVVMALAGSNGGSWSTSYSPKGQGVAASDHQAGDHQGRVTAIDLRNAVQAAAGSGIVGMEKKREL